VSRYRTSVNRWNYQGGKVHRASKWHTTQNKTWLRHEEINELKWHTNTLILQLCAVQPKFLRMQSSISQLQTVVGNPLHARFAFRKSKVLASCLPQLIHPQTSHWTRFRLKSPACFHSRLNMEADDQKFIARTASINHKEIGSRLHQTTSTNATSRTANQSRNGS
jgi:hypothetical protein